MNQRLRVIVRIKGHLVPVAAEPLATVEPFMATIALTLVLVQAGGIAVIVYLKDTVMLNDPGHFLAHVGADDCSGKL